ncbi:EAL domain-containing protein [Moritella sp. 28]|nr:EAL domain-containing protein [Moritella sp. 28]
MKSISFIFKQHYFFPLFFLIFITPSYATCSTKHAVTGMLPYQNEAIKIGVVSGSLYARKIANGDFAYKIIEKPLKSCLGVETLIIQKPLAELLALAKSGKVDLIFDLAKSKERNQYLDYSISVSDEAPYIVSSNSLTNSLKSGQSIATLKGSAWIEMTKVFLESIGFENNIKLVGSISDLNKEPLFVSGSSHITNYHGFKMPISEIMGSHIAVIKSKSDILLPVINEIIEGIDKTQLEKEIIGFNNQYLSLSNATLQNGNDINVLMDFHLFPFYADKYNNLLIFNKYKNLADEIYGINLIDQDCHDDNCFKLYGDDVKMAIYDKEKLSDRWPTNSLGLVRIVLFKNTDINDVKRIGIMKEMPSDLRSPSKKYIEFLHQEEMVEYFMQGGIDAFISTNLDGKLLLAQNPGLNFTEEQLSFKSVVFLVPKEHPDSKALLSILNSLIEISNNTGYVAVDKHARELTLQSVIDGKKELRLRDFYSYIILSIIFVVYLYFVYKKVTVDPLTKLLNSSLMKKYHKKKSYNYITYISISNLESIKKVEGVEYANNVIKTFSSILVNSFPKVDKIFRLYGDHFVVFSKNSSVEILEYRLGILKNNSEKQKVIFNCGVKKMTCDIKLDLIASTEAMYANSLNDGALFYSYENSKEVQDYINKNVIKEVITQALKYKSFSVNFQPKFDLKLGVIYGAEALARLYVNGQHYSPAVFVNYLEKCGRVPELDYLILEKTIDFIKINNIYDVVFSVNVSSESIACETFKKKFRAILTENDMIKNLELEIIESIASEHKNAVISFITEIRNDFGVQISLDDFTTGNSSMILLSEFRFDCIKLDRSLFNAMHNNDKFKRSVKNLIKEIRNFSDDIVFEGIENEEDESLVIELGVNKVQGWKYSKPISPSDFMIMIIGENANL